MIAGRAAMAVAAVVGALVASAPAYLVGHVVGSRAGRLAALHDGLIEQAAALETKGIIRDEVSKLDSASMCDRFGLSDGDRRECVHRFRQHNADVKDGDLHNGK